MSNASEPQHSQPSKSPFDRLPTELQIQVFRRAVEPPQTDLFIVDQPHSSHISDKLDYANPLLLCAICSRWRTLAFSTPDLWTNLRVYFPKLTSGEHACTLLKEWMNRATVLSITLYNKLYPSLYEPEVDLLTYAAYQDIRDILLEATGRCVTLTITCRLDDYFWDMPLGPAFWQPLLDKGMPMLRELYFIGPPWFDTVDLGACPQLHTIAGMTAYQYFRLPVSQTYSLSQLKTTSGESSIISILNANKSLVRFDCWIDSQYTQQNQMQDARLGQQRVLLPNLLHLELGTQHVLSKDTTPLTHILTPSLKHLRIHDLGTGTPFDFWPQIHTCLTNSRPPLEHMDLKIRASFSDMELVEALRWMPSLKLLKLTVDTSQPMFTSSFWHSLTELASSDSQSAESSQESSVHKFKPHTICPNLEVLQLITNDSTGHDLANIAPFILSRFPSSSSLPVTPNTHTPTLRELLLKPCSFKSADFLHYPGIHTLISAGLIYDIGDGRGWVSKFTVNTGGALPRFPLTTPV